MGKNSHCVAVTESAAERPVQTFGSPTVDLETMAAWLKSCGVAIVAMEPTGVYWIPLYDVLDKRVGKVLAGFRDGRCKAGEATIAASPARPTSAPG